MTLDDDINSTFDIVTDTRLLHLFSSPQNREQSTLQQVILVSLIVYIGSLLSLLQKYVTDGHNCIPMYRGPKLKKKIIVQVNIL